MARAIRQREEKLLAGEARYRDLFEKALDIIYTVDLEGNFIEVNEAFLREGGYKREEIVGHSFQQMLHPDDAGPAAEVFEKGRRGEPVEFEIRARKKDGSFDWYSFINRPIPGKEGRPVAVHGIARNISVRREAEEALRQSENRFKELFDSVSDLIYTQDLEGRFLSANRAMTTLFGYQPEEFLGRPAADFMKPELRPFYETEYLTILRETGRHQGISAYFAKNGRRFFLEYVSSLVAPEKGEPFISGIARDVTDRVLAERAIREREQRIQAILEATPEPLVAYDGEGLPQFINPAFTRTFGWTLEELKGKPIPFVPEDQKAKTAETIKTIYRTGEAAALETQRFTKDGRVLDILIGAALIKGPHEKPSGMVVSLSDLTEKKKMEAGLIQVQKMEAIGVLAGGIAHDFNNLLMGIQGNASLLRLDLAADHPFHQRLQDIEQYAGQGTLLTRQLLGFARGGKYEVRPLDLQALIREHDQVFGRTRKDVRMRETWEEGLWTVAADESQMRQVLMNLYINAADAMPQGGNISVQTKNVIIEADRSRPFQVIPGRYVRISVTDTGSGMDPETRQRIFEPFFTTKETGRGTGLGLSSVYGIVKNHGGFIEVESEPGRGSAFHIYLPASAEIREAARRGPTLSEKGLLQGEGTILLVDDEAMILEVGQAILGRLGYRVVAFSQAREALAYFKNHPEEIDLVILDLIMPEMGGGTLFDRLQILDPAVKVLISSGYSLDGQSQAILNRGARGFIQKPFTIEALAAKVREACS
jgi:PAS domain S-box-containing protein